MTKQLCSENNDYILFGNFKIKLSNVTTTTNAQTGIQTAIQATSHLTSDTTKNPDGT